MKPGTPYRDQDVASVRISHVCIDTHGLDFNDKDGFVQVSVEGNILEMTYRSNLISNSLFE